MLRKILFWTHLSFGVSAGLAIAVMSFTGAALAFEREQLAWAERDARRIESPANGATRLTLEEILQRVRTGQPEVRIASVAISTDPRAAIALGLPGNKMLYANPFTGETREGQAPRMRAFITAMRSWHTRLNFTITPGKPTLGAQLNSAANVVFVLLCLSGLVLWWPRAWNARVLRPSLWFVRDAQGRARDWNWHNVFGFWSLPALIIMAASGVVLSYRWAGDLVFRLAGETPPTPGSAAPAGVRRDANPPVTPPAGTPLGPDGLLAAAQRHVASWESVTLRFNPPLQTPASSGPRSPSATVVAAVRERHQWPPFSVTTLALDAQTGEVRRADTFATLSLGQRARRWIRVLHTGEAFGWPSQLVFGVACLGGCVLVWTGLALAWRRFFGKPETLNPASGPMNSS